MCFWCVERVKTHLNRPWDRCADLNPLILRWLHRLLLVRGARQGIACGNFSITQIQTIQRFCASIVIASRAQKQCLAGFVTIGRPKLAV